MKFVLASWGSRGDVEPNLAVGSELVRRGHDVCMAVPPDLVAFTKAAGVTAVGFGPEAQSILDSHRDFQVAPGAPQIDDRLPDIATPDADH